jgi:hypothetical protein
VLENVTKAKAGGGGDAGIHLDKYIEASRKLDTTDIDWHRVREYPLDEGVCRTLVYMADIEGYTITYHRDMLNTAAINDHEIARFMTLWAYEELFHQEALARFLAEYGVTFEPDRGRRLRVGRSIADRVVMTGAALLSFITEDFVPAYMTWGAVNELTAATGYELLAQRAQHPILAKILMRMVKDERRHFAFYYQKARQRLVERPAARLLTREVLRRFWRPVGNGVKTLDEVYHMVGTCYAGENGRLALREIDLKIAKLPGLDGFDRCERFYDELEAVRRQRARS